MARRAVLWAGIALFAVALVATATMEITAVEGSLIEEGPSPFWVTWIPMGAGILLLRMLTPSRRHQALDRRVQDTLKPHPIVRETALLGLCLAGFLLGLAIMSYVFGLVSEGFPWLAAPAVRFIFLLLLPVLLVDRAGMIRSEQGDTMAGIAMRIDEPWRWSGAVAVAGVLALILAGQWDGFLPFSLEWLITLFGILFAVALPEEIFYRGMLQSRLECLFGRHGGIVLAAAVFGLVYALMGGYEDVARGDPWTLGASNLLLSLATFGVSSLMYGYLWSRYRNIWLNILLRAGVITLITGPAVSILE
ncbi:CPBP family glutamic-type intramembrane protease [Marinactinospora thermotolerans]|uniref:CAAX protease self-immunity n=1 Tax=Marinactinospora thermotolerans DSM 45154 TaxID=1122192 RepID=A0A1T4TA92_9ACTN|nr:CPBP family intramembrane glutamic endopeptidase [Marinactinospora thermotolerans]SKA37435.1 CAAX protease self-immunity [Marinactinospora thermotolerans DSM 45154]